MGDMVGLGLGLATSLFLRKKAEEKRKEKERQRREQLPDKPCDMCQGTGKEYGYATPVMGTTGGYQLYDQNMNPLSDEDVKNIPIVEKPCGTCKGTGILPKHLMVEYWK